MNVLGNRHTGEIGIPRMAEPKGPQRSGPASAGPLPLEEVAERAARLGITLDRVLEALAWIAFGDITRVVSWDTDTLTMTASGDLDEADRAAVAEIIASNLPREDARQADGTRLVAPLARQAGEDEERSERRRAGRR